METVFVLLMVTIGLSHAIETDCDARQNGTQCYAALGGTVGLRLVEKFEKGFEYNIKKHNTIVIVKIKNNRPVIPDQAKEYKNRSSFNVRSGTFEMSDITRSDEAHYVLTITDGSSGKLNETKHLHLSVQAPVSPPELSSECLSQGQMRVSCSCEGDGVQYSWTLDGQTLSGHHDTQNVTLIPGTSGLLGCVVYNSFSRDVVEENISPCTYHSGWIYFQVAEMCVLLVVCVGFYIYYKIKTRPPPKQDPLYGNMVVMDTQ